MSHPAAGPPPPSGRSARFDFEHKVFGLEGAYFMAARSDGEPSFYVRLGAVEVALDLDLVRREFEIQRNSHDDELLDLIARSLNHVKIIRPGDSIPNEILDGSASWNVDDHHLAAARARLQLRIANAVDDHSQMTSETLIAAAEDPRVKAALVTGLGTLAERLGLGPEGVPLVEEKIERFARDMSYIEALREHAGQIRGIRRRLQKALELYRRERTQAQEIQRMLTLIRKPVQFVDEFFQDLDAQTGEVLVILKRFEQQLTYVRDRRDLLHRWMMDWEDVFRAWSDVVMVRGAGLDAALKVTYQHLATHFPEVVVWPRMERMG